LTIELPKLPEQVPGEPSIGQDKIITKDEDHIILEYEIEFPKTCKDFQPHIPGDSVCDPLPSLPVFDMVVPRFKEPAFPYKFSEKSTIIKLPLTIYSKGKLTIGKIPKPLKPKPFQKVLNTIPMPMKIKSVPFKPVSEPRTQRQPKQKSPPARPDRPEILTTPIES
jgi:hypothetical protein